MIRPATLLSTLVLTFLATFAYAQQSDIDAVQQSGISNLSTHAGDVYASAQPTQAQLQALAQAGVKHIVNLRPVEEQDFDEATYVRSLGMEYHSIPVAGAADLTTDNAQRLDELLTNLNGQPVLVHCASSNRVGALRSITATEKDGLNVDAALAVGRQWGLTGMEPAVRQVLVEKAGQ